MWYTALCFLILIVCLLRCLLRLSMPRCYSNVCMVGKTVVITGGNKGIGFQTSLGLAARGCKLIIACRSDAQKEKKEIIRLTNNTNVIVKHLDLGSFSSIRKFAKEVHETCDKVDVLINNAGIGSSYGLSDTEDGYDALMQTNLFGPFLLTHLLLDLLRKSGNGRIVFISSILAFFNRLTDKNLTTYKPDDIFSYIYHYGNSKVGLAIISKEFAIKLKDHGITSNALSPGYVKTGVFDNIKSMKLWKYWICLAVCSIFTMTVVDCAQIPLIASISNKYKNITGQFIGEFGQIPKKSRDPEFRSVIWKQLEDIVQLKQEEVI